MSPRPKLAVRSILYQQPDARFHPLTGCTSPEVAGGFQTGLVDRERCAQATLGSRECMFGSHPNAADLALTVSFRLGSNRSSDARTVDDRFRRNPAIRSRDGWLAPR